MALYLCQNFVSPQYLENQLVEFHQILYMHSSWQDLASDCYTSFFTNLYQSYGPWFMLILRFRSISWEPIGRISPNFIYAFILTRSKLGSLHIIFCTFVPELWPLIYSQNWFLSNILRANGQILIKLYITIYTDKIYLGIASCHFSQISKRVLALDWCQNYVTTQYPETLWPFTTCKALQRGHSQILWQF